MIHYQLRCSRDHEFDGWFRDSAAFAKQAAAKLVECPECGDVAVSRALMAPSLGRKGNAKAKAAPPPVIDQQGADQQGAGQQSRAAAGPAGPARPAEPVGAAMPDQLRAMLQKLRAEVETQCEHVGPRFAEEARAIHNGESQARGIYGQATPEQAEALAEDGIEVARIPWVPRADG
ncbi:MAG: DUF1178 family protein [Janthinobacterium lividum]